MSKNLIRKNINLSLEFDRYVVSNPSVLKSVPSGAHIILTSRTDKKLSDANLNAVRGSRAGRFVEAHKSGAKWAIRKVSASR